MSGCCGPVKSGCCAPTPSTKPADSGCCGPSTPAEGPAKLPKAALQKAWTRRANGGSQVSTAAKPGDPVALELEKQRSEQERAQAAERRDARRSARKA